MSIAAAFSVFVALALVCLTADRARAAEPTQPPSGPAARGVVESFHAVLLGCMTRSDALGFEGRYWLIAENMDETFDLEALARASIFRGWKRLSRDDRSRWVALSRRYWASNYAHEYGNFSGQTFETLGVEPADEGGVVHARLTRPNGDDVELDYRLRRVDGGWRIVDFYVAGASHVRRLREFNYAVLERRGFEALVTEIGQKIEQFQLD